MHVHLSALTARALALVILLFAVTSGHAAEGTKMKFDLSAGEASRTLKQFAAQAKREILFATQPVDGVKTNAVKGELTVREGLDRLLAGTDVKVIEDEKTGALVVRGAESPNAPRAASDPATAPKDPSKAEPAILKLETFEVMGQKVLNMDVKRSRDDAQPYVIFNRLMIEQSGATTVEDFIRQRLPQDATQSSESQVNSTIGPRSQVNLRGLGPNQTLILIDGRRMSGASVAGTLIQPDLNGIPLNAIERIEVLPTTASGIYGGSATGGVINIILRRDYAGVELKTTYDNSFDSDSANRRVDLSAGFTLEHGKTNVLLAASWSKQGLLLTQDRDFLTEGMKKLLANNPAFFATGSPPLGSTPNLRASNGTNLVLKPQYGGTVLSSPFTFIPAGYTGVASDNGAALIANAGKYNLELPDTLQNRGKRSSLQAGPERISMMGTVRRQFTPWLQGFLEFQGSRTESHFPVATATGLYSIPTTTATNPFTTTVQVAVPLAGGDIGIDTVSKQARIAGGVIVSLPHDWKATADYSRDESRFANSLPVATVNNADSAAMQAGTLNPFRDVNLFPIDLTGYYSQTGAEAEQRSSSFTAAARAAGPLWSLPAGAPTVSALFEHRGDIYLRSIYGNALIIPRRTQFVYSGYIEVKVPVISPAMKVPFVRELELQVAGRRDHYDITATNTAGTDANIRKVPKSLSSTDPTVGLRWQLMPALTLRGSYGTGYLPPTVAQLSPNPSVSGTLSGLTDPKRGNEPVLYRIISGGNPNLVPEQSKTFSAGAIFAPGFVPGLRLSVDWNKIDKRDNIASIPTQQMVNFEDFLPAGTITRLAPVAGSAYPVGTIDIINISPVNFAKANVESYDFQLDYGRDTARYGRFEFSALATRSVHYTTQLTPTAPVVENVGFGSIGTATSFASSPIYPMKWKGNASVTWRQGPWSLGWRTRYIHEYFLNPASTSAATILAQGNGGRIDAQLWHDVFFGYRFGVNAGAAGDGWRAGLAQLLRRTEIQAGVRNVFNTAPAFDMSSIGRLYSAQADARVSSYYVTLKKSF